MGQGDLAGELRPGDVVLRRARGIDGAVRTVRLQVVGRDPSGDYLCRAGSTSRVIERVAPEHLTAASVAVQPSLF